MATHIEKGDAVALNQLLEIKEMTDANNGKFMVAELPWQNVKDKKRPYTLFETIVGLYMGMKYVPERQAKRGVVQVARHSFLFSDREVFIDPKFIDVVSKFSESSDERK